MSVSSVNPVCVEHPPGFFTCEMQDVSDLAKVEVKRLLVSGHLIDWDLLHRFVDRSVAVHCSLPLVDCVGNPQLFLENRCKCSVPSETSSTVDDPTDSSVVPKSNPTKPSLPVVPSIKRTIFPLPAPSTSPNIDELTTLLTGICSSLAHDLVNNWPCVYQVHFGGNVGVGSSATLFVVVGLWVLQQIWRCLRHSDLRRKLDEVNTLKEVSKNSCSS